MTRGNGSVANAVNGRNQVTAVAGSSVSHDNRGNVTAAAGATYAYSPENRLTHGPGSSVYAYDALGRLYFGGAASGDYLQSDGGTIAAELGSGATLRRRYVHGPGVDEPLVWYEGTGTGDRRWFHADERGSVVAVSDGSGDLVGGTPNRYDEYGAPQGSLTGRFGYTGQAWLPDAGLYHYRNRAYNPTMGRFMQADPIGFGGGMNLYAYVGNNPVNFTDPLGLDGPDCRQNPDDDNCVDVTGPRRPRRVSYDWEFSDVILLDLGASLGQQCRLPLGVIMTIIGDSIFLTGELKFVSADRYTGANPTPTSIPGTAVPRSVQEFVIGSINSIWTSGPTGFGRYNVTTNMRIGDGGGMVFVTPGGANGHGPPGGGSWFEWSNNMSSSERAAAILAAHEFGHGMGLVSDGIEGHDTAGAGIMSGNAFANPRPTERNIAELKARCLG